MACEIEKAFNSSDEVDSKEVNFSEILSKFIAWLGLNDHIQVDDCTKFDNRLSKFVYKLFFEKYDAYKH